jgi:hypothetical protein
LEDKKYNNKIKVLRANMEHYKEKYANEVISSIPSIFGRLSNYLSSKP